MHISRLVALTALFAIFALPALSLAAHDRALTTPPNSQGQCASGYSLNTSTNKCELIFTHVTSPGQCPSGYDFHEPSGQCRLLRVIARCGANEVYDTTTDTCVPNTANRPPTVPPNSDGSCPTDYNKVGEQCVLQTTTTPSDPNSFNLKLVDPIGAGGVLELLDKIINTLMLLAGPIAVIMVLYAAFLYTTSGGNEERAKTANRTLLYVVIGFAG